MIKINLPDDFSEDIEISRIYLALSQKIADNLEKITGCVLSYEGNECTPDQKMIKKFLLARDFYKYSFNDIQKTVLEEVFSYKKLTQGGGINSENRHQILTKMNIPVCPYCNINYTSSYEFLEQAKTTADLDHFYAKNIKSKPEYGLCFYNFVPSCPVCNSRFKGQDSMARETHTFPHEEGWGDDIRFEIDNLIDCVLDSAVPRVTLAEYGSDQAKIDRAKASAELFRIEERYDAQHVFVSDLLEKAVIYSESYQEELNSFFEGETSALQVKYAVFGSHLSDKDCLNTSLGKLKKDVLSQLQVY